MCILEDPYGTVPSNLSTALGCRVATGGVHYQRRSLTWRPHLSQRWLYTKDFVTTDDRDEMPGDFVYCTTSFTSSLNPGFITVEYMLEFTDMCNSTVASPHKEVGHKSVVVHSQDMGLAPLPNPEPPQEVAKSEPKPDLVSIAQTLAILQAKLQSLEMAGQRKEPTGCG